MPRVSQENESKYQQATKYFSLKNDKESARVRFMYSGSGEVERWAVHKVKVGNSGWDKYVDCLRGVDDPLDACPFCKAKMGNLIRIFVPLYMVETGEVKLWDKARSYGDELEALMARYYPLVSFEFEIQRHGGKNDPQTRYIPYPGQQDGTTLESLPPIPEILGTDQNSMVVSKTFDEMVTYLQTGDFPRNQAAGQPTIQRRQIPTKPIYEPPTVIQPPQSSIEYASINRATVDTASTGPEVGTEQQPTRRRRSGITVEVDPPESF